MYTRLRVLLLIEANLSTVERPQNVVIILLQNTSAEGTRPSGPRLSFIAFKDKASTSGGLELGVQPLSFGTFPGVVGDTSHLVQGLSEPQSLYDQLQRSIQFQC